MALEQAPEGISEVEALLQSYPRARPPLSNAYEHIYLDEYRRNRGAYGGAVFRLTGILERWMHRRVAEQQSEGRVLELGAGTLNHLQYESKVRYDIVEPMVELYRDSVALNRVDHTYSSIADISEHVRYNRVISIAVLEHVEDLPGLVARSGMLLDREGVFQAGIPAEGGMLWGLAWRMTTGILYRMRTGLQYGPLMRHEHLNTALEIIAIVRYFFRTVALSWFPLPSRHLSFYCYIEARHPHRSRCASLATADNEYSRAAETKAAG